MRIAALVLLAACSSSAQPPTSPTEPAPPPPGDQPKTTPEESPAPTPAVMTPEECASKGGKVKHDIGDGKIACGDNERELGNVRSGIEGGVCCAPAS